MGVNLCPSGFVLDTLASRQALQQRGAISYWRRWVIQMRLGEYLSSANLWTFDVEFLELVLLQVPLNAVLCAFEPFDICLHGALQNDWRATLGTGSPVLFLFAGPGTEISD